VSRTQAYRGALEAVERILNRGGDADDVLRAIVGVLAERVPHLGWVGIAFVEDGNLVVGPASGPEPPAETVALPIEFRDDRVGELRVASPAGDDDERAFLERVALLVSPYCLVGWDTGGEPWEA
jgi:hypothetical protein